MTGKTKTEQYASATRWLAGLLEQIEPEPYREGVLKTPQRAARMWVDELLAGYEMDPEDVLGTTFDVVAEELIIVRRIPVYSTCEHHLMPFIGFADVGYIPTNHRVVGLSKLARLVDGFSRRLQIQERLTSQIADTLMVSAMGPQGVMVVIDAEHLCMTVRGIQTPGTVTTTSAVRGVFETDSSARSEFLTLISRPHPSK